MLRRFFNWLFGLFKRKPVKTPIEAPKPPILSTTPDYQRKLANASFKASQRPSRPTPARKQQLVVQAQEAKAAYERGQPDTSTDWVTPILLYEALKNNERKSDDTDSFKGQGSSYSGNSGTFDGGGASGDWSSDSESTSRSYSSDSGSNYSSSYDSGSSGSSCDSSSSSDSGSSSSSSSD